TLGLLGVRIGGRAGHARGRELLLLLALLGGLGLLLEPLGLLRGLLVLLGDVAAVGLLLGSELLLVGGLVGLALVDDLLHGRIDPAGGWRGRRLGVGWLGIRGRPGSWRSARPSGGAGLARAGGRRCARQARQAELAQQAGLASRTGGAGLELLLLGVERLLLRDDPVGAGGHDGARRRRRAGAAARRLAAATGRALAARHGLSPAAPGLLGVGRGARLRVGGAPPRAAPA